MSEVKKCGKCKKIKSKELFWKEKKTKDGLYCYCKSCASKEHKEYVKNNKDKLEITARKWRIKHKQKLNKKQRDYGKRINYVNEKTPEQRKIRSIKRETRRLYPLGKVKCKYCNNIATEHHHTTKPITIDNFEYVCHKHHIQAERQLKRR